MQASTRHPTDENPADRETCVFVVEDDDDMRHSLDAMFLDEGLLARSFASPQEFLEHYEQDQPGCLVLDLQLPDMNGLEFYDTLRQRGCQMPFIVITGYGNVPRVVEAFRKGAVDFLEKPFRFEHLLDRVIQALKIASEEYRERTRSQDIARRCDTLTPREREFMGLLLAGFSTKQAARQLGISPKTAHIHRAKVLEKMLVDNTVQLVRLVSHLPEGDDAQQFSY